MNLYIAEVTSGDSKQSQAQPAVLLEDLTKVYGKHNAVDSLDLEISPGQCFGFLGPNGAGKSTTMRMLYGFTRPTSGSAIVLGRDVKKDLRRLKQEIGVVPQTNNLDPDLPVQANLQVYCRYLGLDRRTAEKQIDRVLSMVALADRRSAKIHELSGGMQRRLTIGRALLGDPKLVLLDEPTTGLDPQARRVVWNLVRQLVADGFTIILTTHYLEEAERLCDNLALIDQGKKVAEGSPADLITEYTGGLVLEGSWGAGSEIPSETLAAVAQAGLQSSKTQDGIVVYNRATGESDTAKHESGEELLEKIPTTGAASRVLRRATLEDVFLMITGHELRESGA